MLPTMSASPTPSSSSDARIEREEDLFSLFEHSYRPEGALVGIESERIGLFTDGRPLRYHDHPGIQDLFAELVARYGWHQEIDYPGAPGLALTRKGASITLEPGSQFELSGAPWRSLHDMARELEVHRDEMRALGDPIGLTLLGIGLHPLARQQDLDWVPKSRYPIMREYLPTRGRYGLDMMRRTATVQANFDYASERDAMHKLRVSLALSPVVTAMFANSPIFEGARHGEKSYRARVWLDMDNDRAGLLPFAWRPDAVLGDYVRWALDVPMFILKRGAHVRRATDFTFRRFMREGIDGEHATQGDWETHLNTLFPEVRIKRTLEVRGADSVPMRYAMGLPALWKGLLYDRDALDAAGALVLPYGVDVWTAIRPEIAARGLAAVLPDGTPLASIARALVGLARAALAKRKDLRASDGADEAVYLDAMEALAHDGRSVSDALFEGWQAEAPDAVAELLRRAAF